MTKYKDILNLNWFLFRLFQHFQIKGKLKCSFVTKASGFATRLIPSNLLQELPFDSAKTCNLQTKSSAVHLNFDYLWKRNELVICIPVEPLVSKV